MEENMHSLATRVIPEIPPISRLPNEILANIFKIVHRHGRYTASGSEQYYELLLSHVTHHWRQIAISLPALWSRLKISESSDEQCMATYVLRSKECDLDVLLELPRVTTTGFQPLISQFLPLIRRLRHLRILSYCIRELFLEFMFLLKPLSTPSLKSLDLEIPDYSYIETTTLRPRVIFGGGTPSLKSLILNGDGMERCRVPSLATVETLQLDGVDFGKIRLTTIKTLLDQCSNLTHLRLVYSYPEFGRPDGSLSPINIIELPRLELLHVQASLKSRHGTTLGNILSRFSSPSLHEVILENLNVTDLYHMLEIFEKTSSYSPKYPVVTNLTLTQFGDVDIGDTIWERFNQEFPAVLHLTLLYWDSSTRTSSNPLLHLLNTFTNLQTLCLDPIIRFNKLLLRDFESPFDDLLVIITENRVSSSRQQSLQKLLIRDDFFGVPDLKNIWPKFNELITVEGCNPMRALHSYRDNWGKEMGFYSPIYSRNLM